MTNNETTYLQVQDLIPTFNNDNNASLYQELGHLSGSVTKTEGMADRLTTALNKVVAQLIHEGEITKENVSFYAPAKVTDKTTGKPVKYVYSYYLADDTSNLVTQWGNKCSVDHAMKIRRMVTEGYGELFEGANYTFFEADCMNKNERDLFLTKKEQSEFTYLNDTVKTQLNRIRTTAMKLLGMRNNPTSNKPLNEKAIDLFDRIIKLCEDPLFPDPYDADEISKFAHKGKMLCQEKMKPSK